MLLNRIAGTVSEKSKENIHGAKNSRNFVFAARSPEKELPDVSLDNKVRSILSTLFSVIVEVTFF